MDHGAPSSYMALEVGTSVVTSDGQDAGLVKRVLADPDNDLYEGLIVATEDGDRFVDADHAGEIYERAVVLGLTRAETEHLPEPTAHPPEMAVDPDDTVERPPAERIGDEIRKAWDLISGKY